MQQSSILVPPRSWKDVPSGASIASGVKSVILVISQDVCAMSITYVDKHVHSWHRTRLHFVRQLGVRTFRSCGRCICGHALKKIHKEVPEIQAELQELF